MATPTATVRLTTYPQTSDVTRHTCAGCQTLIIASYSNARITTRFVHCNLYRGKRWVGSETWCVPCYLAAGRPHGDPGPFTLPRTVSTLKAQAVREKTLALV